MTKFNQPYLMFGFGGFNLAFTAGLFAEAGLSRQIIAVQRERDSRSEAFFRQDGIFNVHISGLRGERVFDEIRSIDSIGELLIAAEQWEILVNIFRGSTLRYILSNTAERGFDVPEEDLTPPKERFGMPNCHIARLLVLLRARMEEGLTGLTIIPFELGEENDRRLLGKLEELLLHWTIRSEDWRNSGQRLKEYLRWSCKFRGTLVDQMVPRLDVDHELYKSGKDLLLRIAEPYRLLVIASSPEERPFLEHQDLIWCADQQPYVLRKLCILNGLHTLMAAHWIKHADSVPRDLTVDKFIGDQVREKWLMNALNQEILPAIQGLVPDEKAFAVETLERFSNSALHFPVSKIAGNHEQKLRDRLLPTARLFKLRTGKLPSLIRETFAWSGLENEIDKV